MIFPVCIENIKYMIPDKVAIEALITIVCNFLATFFTSKFWIDWIKMAVPKNKVPLKKSKLSPVLFP